MLYLCLWYVLIIIFSYFNDRNIRIYDIKNMYIYIVAVFGFFFPLIGFIAMCVFDCGGGPRMPPNSPQKTAFNVLVGATIGGIILTIILVVAG